MTIQNAVQRVADHIRNTGQPLSEAVIKVWPSLSFSKEDERVLMQQAIASRVSSALTNTVRTSDGSAYKYKSNTVPSPLPSFGSVPIKPVQVSVQTTFIEPKVHDVKIHILKDTTYQINGVSKAIINFSRYDVHTKLESTRAVEEGVVRHRKVWEYLHDRMKELGKYHVFELAEGEQLKLARKIYDIKTSKEPLSLEK